LLQETKNKINIKLENLKTKYEKKQDNKY